MDKLVHAFQVFAGVIAPWLTASLIPSLVVGLTPFPKASKVLKVLSFMAKCLSVVTHLDEAGTFQIPVITPVARLLRPQAVAKASVALVLLGVTLVGACATFRAAFVASEKQCQADNLPSNLVGALPQVTAILANPVTWEAGLIALGAQLGEEQVKCLVMAVEAGIQASHQTDAGTKSAVALTPEEQLILEHAHAYLAAHK